MSFKVGNFPAERWTTRAVAVTRKCGVPWAKLVALVGRRSFDLGLGKEQQLDAHVIST